jgi:hypothetical protein
MRVYKIYVYKFKGKTLVPIGIAKRRWGITLGTIAKAEGLEEKGLLLKWNCKLWSWQEKQCKMLAFGT